MNKEKTLEAFREQLKEISYLRNHNFINKDFLKWNDRTLQYIKSIFGENSYHYRKWINRKFTARSNELETYRLALLGAEKQLQSIIETIINTDWNTSNEVTPDTYTLHIPIQSLPEMLDTITANPYIPDKTKTEMTAHLISLQLELDKPEPDWEKLQSFIVWALTQGKEISLMVMANILKIQLENPTS